MLEFAKKTGEHVYRTILSISRQPFGGLFETDVCRLRVRHTALNAIRLVRSLRN